jgi:hypothetical protein
MSGSVVSVKIASTADDRTTQLGGINSVQRRVQESGLTFGPLRFHSTGLEPCVNGS